MYCWNITWLLFGWNSKVMRQQDLFEGADSRSSKKNHTHSEGGNENLPTNYIMSRLTVNHWKEPL